MNFIFLTQQSVVILFGAAVTDGLDSGRCMEQQCMVPCIFIAFVTQRLGFA